MREYNKAETRRLFRRLRSKPGWQAGAAVLAREAHWRVGKVKDAHLCDIDFRGPRLRGWLGTRGRISSSQFIRVNLDGIDAQRIDFVDCRFHGVTIERYLPKFSRCRFIRCEFDDCHLGGALFEHCEFVGCELSGITAEQPTCWRHCRFEATRLTGRLRDASFLFGEFVNCDFSAAELPNACFADSSCLGVRLPDSPELFAVTPQTMERAVERLTNQLDGDSLRRYEAIVSQLADANDVELVHRELFSQELGPAGGQAVVDTLYAMTHQQTAKVSDG